MTQASFRTAHPLFLNLEQEVADVQRDFEHQILLRRPLPFRFDGLPVSHGLTRRMAAHGTPRTRRA